MGKKRLDDLLVERGIAADRQKATALILSGLVWVERQRLDKPGTQLDPTSEIQFKSKELRYVSRGGLKLEEALRCLSVPVSRQVCLDLGASTGGFTDCLLQHGARKVYAFDVGRGQLDWKLRQDRRVVVRDGVNVRYLAPSMVPDRVDLITIDVSFISLRLILLPLKQFPSARVLALVKPQFEAERSEVEAGGVIKSPKRQRQIVERIKSFARQEGFVILGETPSPIAGQKGNREYFLLLGQGDT